MALDDRPPCGGGAMWIDLVGLFDGDKLFVPADLGIDD